MMTMLLMMMQRRRQMIGNGVDVLHSSCHAHHRDSFFSVLSMLLSVVMIDVVMVVMMVDNKMVVVVVDAVTMMEDRVEVVRDDYWLDAVEDDVVDCGDDGDD